MIVFWIAWLAHTVSSYKLMPTSTIFFYQGELNIDKLEHILLTCMNVHEQFLHYSQCQLPVKCFYFKVFYVMGKVLTGKLSCTQSDLVKFLQMSFSCVLNTGHRY